MMHDVKTPIVIKKILDMKMTNGIRSKHEMGLVIKMKMKPEL